MPYSKELISEVQEYFHRRAGEVLSDEQAVERLDALADLFEVMGRATRAQRSAQGSP